MPCELAWNTAASILAAAPSLRSLTLLGPPPPPASPALCHPQLRTAHLAVHAWTVATLDVLSSSPGLEELTLAVHLEVRSTRYPRSQTRLFGTPQRIRPEHSRSCFKTHSDRLFFRERRQVQPRGVCQPDGQAGRGCVRRPWPTSRRR